MTLFTETLTLRRPGEDTGERDEYGDPVPVEPIEYDQRCWYEPRSSSRDVEAKDQTTDGYWIYMPIDADWTVHHEARIRGDWYIAAGEVGVQPGGFIAEGYQYVPVTLTRG